MRTFTFMVALTVWPLRLAGAESPSGRTGAPAAATPPPCSPAAITDVRLPAPVAVDEIRVVVGDRSPLASAASVRVDAGAFDRVLRLRGPTSHALKFHPAMTSDLFRVELGPVLFAPSSPCIERIELWRAGSAVAAVTP